MGRVENKVALVTGAARGQGRSHALRLAEEGADIIAIDLCEQIDTVPYEMSNDADLAETAKLIGELGRRIVARKADVRNEEQMTSAVAEGVAELGRLDIVVANAGIVTDAPALELSEAKWNDAIDVDLKGVWITSKVGARHIVNGGRGGSIVMTGSMMGLHGGVGILPYVAAKHGVVGLMRGLGIELGPHMIRVNSVHPTQVNTPMVMNEDTWKAFVPGEEHPTLEQFAAASQTMHTLPVSYVEPLDISNAILFLVSDEARYITGAMLPVDCGCELVN